MMDLENIIEQEREAIVAEASSWLATPYHHQSFIKGVGVDCAMILHEVYGTLFPEVAELKIEHYPPDWHMHRDDERYLNIVKHYADEVAEPKPGDIVVVRFGRAFAHGGIVVKYPICIHAYMEAGSVVLEDFVANQQLNTRKKIFLSPWLRKYGQE
jgi:cell wall-associated NlpC family hydrolase